MKRTLESYIPKKYQAAVALIEKDLDGVWIYLNPGYRFENGKGSRVMVEYTIPEALANLRKVVYIDLACEIYDKTQDGTIENNSTEQGITETASKVETKEENPEDVKDITEQEQESKEQFKTIEIDAETIKTIQQSFQSAYMVEFCEASGEATEEEEKQYNRRSDIDTQTALIRIKYRTGYDAKFDYNFGEGITEVSLYRQGKKAGVFTVK